MSETSEKAESGNSKSPANFIRQIIDGDIKSGKVSHVVTRFPPEPNGYLHIGHAKAICLSFSIAQDYEGRCHLRFDDTNPAAEDTEYVESIKRDIQWLGFDWGENLFFASDYFTKIYGLALQLIKTGKAYVCELTQKEWVDYRGIPSRPGKDSPYRDRSVEENLSEFEKMKNGEYEEGSRVLRARIDMSSPNIHMRDPAIYRIKNAVHHRTGSDWKIYPMYDFTHCLSDSIEGVTHSLCTLEFEVHRQLYEWVLEVLDMSSKPKQIEFARLNLNYSVMSKRKFLKLVDEGYVDGWDDPRMPTLSGMRRRGYTPESIRNFCNTVGITKFKSITDISLLEHSLRQDLNARSHRAMVVLDPVKIVITNLPEDHIENLTATLNPEDPDAGVRDIPFTREIYIDRNDFMLEPPKKFFRLSPGREVRLKYAYIIKCEDVIKDPDSGEVIEIHCSYDPETKSGTGTSTKKVKGTLHWVSKGHGIPLEVRLFDRLFSSETPEDRPEENHTFIDDLNPDSLSIKKSAIGEPSLKNNAKEKYYQFERTGYFVEDSKFSKPDKLVFNRSVALRDSWSKAKK